MQTRVQALPITLFGQYRLFSGSDAVRPYAGLDLMYANILMKRASVR
jgi:outer membrane protein W